MDETVNITAATATLLKEAQEAPSGRAAHTLKSAAHAPLKQTLMALLASQSLAEHTAPGPATIMVLHGSVKLRSSDGDIGMGAGDWAPIPRARHSLDAAEDAVVLLTVAAADADAQ